MPARLHPGDVIHCWDHCVIDLRTGGRRTGYLSLYAISWSPELGPGHVAFLVADHPSLPSPVELAIADDAGLGERMQRRLARMGADFMRFDGPVLSGRFERRSTRHALAFLIQAGDRRVEARWEALAPPVWAEGPAPAFTGEEDIWALFAEAGGASLTLDGLPIPGQPYRDEAWLPKLGIPFGSAHLALAEVRVRPDARRRPG